MTTETTTPQTLRIDGREVALAGERNLLELVRKIGIDLPTFCYHSDLSIYGACRLCLVDIAGRGIQAACSTPPEPGLEVKTHTAELREIRQIAIELLLASHDNSCTTCGKSANCRLLGIAHRLGVRDIRYQQLPSRQPLDEATPSLVRNPGKCILCGDCVRVCSELQGIGAIDFVGRGAKTCVAPAFHENLDKGECVLCGQCAAVCPTGAIVPKSQVDAVWRQIHDPRKKVVVQVAPAVRVALGEIFGVEPSAVTTGKMVAALRAVGFDQVYDTAWAADLTIFEEASEFIRRKSAGEKLPLFTSCCPAWVKYAEQYYPEFLPNLSTCKSPMGMFSAVAKELLPAQLGIERADLAVAAIMPCTAKKFEAARPEFAVDGQPDTDFVLTTQELGRMIEEAGLDFRNLPEDSFDEPFGVKTGAGVIFGATGGVMEAALRFAVEKLTGQRLDKVDFPQLRGDRSLREATFHAGGLEVKVAVVYSLKRAKQLLADLQQGRCAYDFIEVMACPGGCVSGGGQPIADDFRAARQSRTAGLYKADKLHDLHKSQDNPAVQELYRSLWREEPGGKQAHHALHTSYCHRRRLHGQDLALQGGQGKLKISVCMGTSCYVRGSQQLLHHLLEQVGRRGLEDRVEVKATFCHERCDRGPTVTVGEKTLERCQLPSLLQEVENFLGAVAK